MAKEKIPVVTVGIPMYNAEKYIEECLQSVLNQTLKNIEVIVIDDCSTDNSLAIVKKMSQQFSDNEISFYYKKLKKNTGCSSFPRNEAINLAKGKYVYFLDSDDFLDETALEEFYNVAEEFNADVVHAEICFMFNDTEPNEKLGNMQEGEFVQEVTPETFDVVKRVEDFIKMKYAWWAWNKLLRRDFIIKNKIKFPTIRMFEDCFFTFQCVICAKNYVRVPFVNYHYRLRENSLSHSSFDSKHLRELLDVVTLFDTFMRNQEVFKKAPQYRYLVLNFFIQTYLKATSDHLFEMKDGTLTDIYDYFYKEVFSANLEKSAAFSAYLFTSLNIYKISVNRQAEEIFKLKNLLQSLSV